MIYEGLNIYTMVSECGIPMIPYPGPTLESANEQVNNRAHQGDESPFPSEKGRFDHSTIREPGYPREEEENCRTTPKPAVWLYVPNQIRTQT